MATHSESRSITLPTKEIFDIFADVERNPTLVTLIRVDNILNRVEDTDESEKRLALGLVMFMLWLAC